MENVHRNRCINHVFRIKGQTDNNLHDAIDKFIRYAVKKRTDLEVSYRVIGTNDILIITLPKAMVLSVKSFEIDEVEFNKIPYKTMFDTLSYYSIKIDTLNKLLDNN